jgi:hypothetical protein
MAMIKSGETLCREVVSDQDTLLAAHYGWP